MALTNFRYALNNFADNSGINYKDPGFNLSPYSLDSYSPASKNQGFDLNSVKNLGELPQAMLISKMFAPNIAEQFATAAPFMKEMARYQQQLANINAEQKFGRDLIGNAISSLTRGAESIGRGGRDEILAARAMAPQQKFSNFIGGYGSVNIPQLQPTSPNQYAYPRYLT